MTSREFLESASKKSPALQEMQARLVMRVFLHHLANEMLDARLRDGQRINDVTDAVVWVREMEEEVFMQTQTARIAPANVQPISERPTSEPQQRWPHDSEPA